MGFRFSIDQVESIDLDLEELVDRRISFVKVEAATLLENLDDAAASIQLHRTKRALDRAGISLVVEKVEAEEQLIELLDYGIDFGQGYLFGPPRLSREGD
jgi:cyclic-di-GMP phosphodiesterase TipF (flagellum assembly factor)